MKKILYLILFLGTSSFASTLGSENIPMKVGQVWKLSSVSMMDEVMPRSIRFLVDEIRGTQGGTAIIYGHHEFSRQNPIIAEYILDTHLLLVIEQKTTRKPIMFQRSRICLFNMEKPIDLYAGFGAHPTVVDSLKFSYPYKGYNSFLQWLSGKSTSLTDKNKRYNLYKSAISQVDSSDNAPCTLELVQ